MTNERMKDLLINCVNSIAYDNDMTKEQLLEIIGFTPKELVELGFDWYEEDYNACIKDVTTNQYVIEESGEIYKVGPYERRLSFFDETDAEATLAALNDNYPDCFVLIREETK